MASFPTRLEPPGGTPQDSGAPSNQFASPAEATAPQNEQLLQAVRMIAANARRLAVMYPAASQNARNILDELTKMQQKIVQSQPPAEPQAPPA